MLIHVPKVHSALIKGRSRYVAAGFPDTIRGRPVDDRILNFWAAAQTGDPARRFLYYFRLIEYTSFTHLEASICAQVRKIIASPDAMDRLDDVVDKVIGELRKSTADDYSKFEGVIRCCVDLDLVWKEIQNNKQFFSVETEFDGGVSIRPIISENMKYDEFSMSGCVILSRTLREIRNGLAHGRDQKTTSIIAPTTRNFELLDPWASLIAAVAGQVAINRDVV